MSAALRPYGASLVRQAESRITPDLEKVEAIIATWSDEAKKLARLLASCEYTVKKAASVVGFPYLKALTLAQLIGWRPQWRKIFSSHTHRIVGKNQLPWGEVVRLYTEEKLPVTDIAVVAGGVSRQRIQQILAYHGINRHDRITKQMRQQQHEELCAARRTQALALIKHRRESQLAHYQGWRDLYKDGLSHAEMAEKLGLSTGSVQATISKLRRDHPDWFPYRKLGWALKAAASPTGEPLTAVI